MNHSKRQTISSSSFFFISEDINFDHLIEMVSSRFLHCNVTIFLSVIKHPMIVTFRLCKYPIFHHMYISSL